MYNKHRIESVKDPKTGLTWGFYEEQVKLVYPKAICINYFGSKRLMYGIIRRWDLIPSILIGKRRFYKYTAWKSAYLALKKKQVQSGE